MLALCLAAGMDGIKNQILPPPNITKNIYEMTEEERKSLGIGELPATLHDAVDAMEADEFVRGILGEHISSVYIEAKKKEWDNYCRAVSEWEVEKYLTKF